MAVTLLLINPPSAHAKRGGGRVGGGSFSRPSVARPSSPSSPYRSSPGGGLFFLPFFFGGGSSLFSGILGLMVLMAIASVVLNSFKGGTGEGITGGNTKVTIVKLQVGLLATARQLQKDLTYMAMEADTSTGAGLVTVLRETTLALLRHPDYWVYVSSGLVKTTFDQAESKYNNLVMSERTKLSDEVLTNQKGRKILKPTNSANALEAPSEYIVVTVIAAITGTGLDKVGTVRSTDDLRSTLMALGSISQDQLVATEILWEPQSEDYTLTADEVLTVYPDLLRI